MRKAYYVNNFNNLVDINSKGIFIKIQRPPLRVVGSANWTHFAREQLIQFVEPAQMRCDT